MPQPTNLPNQQGGQQGGQAKPKPTPKDKLLLTATSYFANHQGNSITPDDWMTFCVDQLSVQQAAQKEAHDAEVASLNKKYEIDVLGDSAVAANKARNKSADMLESLLLSLDADDKDAPGLRRAINILRGVV